MLLANKSKVTPTPINVTVPIHLLLITERKVEGLESRSSILTLAKSCGLKKIVKKKKLVVLWLQTKGEGKLKLKQLSKLKKF